MPMHRLCCAFLSAALFSAGVGAVGPDTYPDGLRKWTPEDSLAVRYFRATQSGSPGVDVSPDGKKFFFIVGHATTAGDAKVAELFVFSVDAVKQALSVAVSGQNTVPQPLRHLTYRSAGTNGSALAAVRWERGGKALSFMGMNDAGGQQYYELDVDSGELTPLTDLKQDIYSMQRIGETIVSNVLVSRPRPELAYPFQVVNRTLLMEAMFPEGTGQMMETSVTYRGGQRWKIEGSEWDFLHAVSAADNSDGRQLIVARIPKTVPAQWSAYDRLSTPFSEGYARPEALQFMLINAEQQRIEPVFDAPAGKATDVGAKSEIYEMALWAADGRHVVLLNTALPLESGKPERARMAYIAGYDLHTREWSELEPLQTNDGAARRVVTGAGWLKHGTALLVTHAIGGKPAAGTVYTLKGNRWAARTVAATVKLPEKWWEIGNAKPGVLSGGLSVKVRQSANDPPVMVASDGHREIALTGEDPALKNVWRARQEPFQWSEDGKTKTGGLLLPRDAKGPVPLVIQSYTYDPRTFMPDGPDRHAYAAQALVAHGMAVLNIDIPTTDAPDVGSSPRELSTFAARIEAAVEALAGRGLIDRNRVGLVGFSRAGFVTRYYVTHPGKIVPAAAVIDDAYSASYSSYVDHGVEDGKADSNAEGLYEGSFWQNKAAWLERASDFNMDRVRTPVLESVHDRDAILQMRGTIGAFAINRRPLEVLAYPNGTHALSAARQRLASQENTVDWMRFWLKNEIPADAAKAGRWAVLRKQQDEVLKMPPPPKGKWVLCDTDELTKELCARKPQ